MSPRIEPGLVHAAKFIGPPNPIAARAASEDIFGE
jgi:hypothetical protein